MHPDSIVLPVLLVLLAGGLLVVLRRMRNRVVGALAGVFALAFAATTGMAVVNDYFGYYQSWSQLSADLTGSYSAFTTSATHTRTDAQLGQGRLVSTTISGDGYTRGALVYLPPQYFAPRFAHARFPVLELIHGTPGAPSDWVVHLRSIAVLDGLLERHLAGPMVLVMPTMSVGSDFQECVDAPGARDDAYITYAVRRSVVGRFRVSDDAAEWGIAGYSSGGYCAVNLALRHRTMFGAAAAMDGYFRPQDGPAAAALHGDATAEAANDPLLLARALTAGTSPLPAFWLSAGTGDAADFAGAKAFATALHGVEQVSLEREPDAGHTFYACSGSLPHLMAWSWQQLAPPDLRADFPIAGGVGTGDIVAPVPLAPTARTGKHHGSHRAVPRRSVSDRPTSSPSPSSSTSRSPSVSAPSSPSDLALGGHR